ncbi:MAG: hypothetical protein NUV50_00970 [Rhodospirillales bacterium]|nr:hypothetical protein [Rhodospirillales bacterium]
MFDAAWRFICDGAAAWRKDFAKWVVGIFAFGLGSLIFSFLFSSIPPEISAGDSFNWDLFWPWFWGEIVSRLGYYGGYLSNHPLRGTLALLGAIVVLIVVVLTWKWFAGKRRVKAEKEKLLLQKVGLSEYWEDAHIERRAEQWGALSDCIKITPQAYLNYIGATGWETFGAKHAPLYDAFTNFRGTIRVILMKPDSSSLSARANSVRMTVKGYKNQIIKSAKFLMALRSRGHQVELRYYDSPPNWKMIFSPRRLWLQHYHNDNHVAECPVYLFYATEDMKGLYHSFAKDFERIWERCEPVDLGRALH